MNITVSRDGVVIGVYLREDIRAALADGSLNADDRYFMQGMSEWRPLSALTKTLGVRETESESTTADEVIPTTAKLSWKRVASSAGYAILAVAAFSALLSPNYWSQALAAAAGGILILAAQTLR